MTNILQVTNDKDITFNVVLSKNEDNKTLVTFYDTRYKHTDYGQQVSRYYADTLIGKCDFSDGGIKDTGLNLYGGVEDWYINANNSNEVVKFIEESEVK
jgi:hypothetical protein